MQLRDRPAATAAPKASDSWSRPCDLPVAFGITGYLPTRLRAVPPATLGAWP
jgi:hypothetical protein